jgi:predicted ribosome quality control (RQC) complex YloA/Tae2 family protein
MPGTRKRYNAPTMAIDVSRSLKVPFDSLTLRAVVSELRRHLIGGQIQDIRQPEPTEVQLGIRSQGRNFLLTLSDDARFARVHLTTRRRANAPTPPNFCMILRKYLEDGVIRALRQRDFDRIFEMDVETRGEDGQPQTTTLIAELMGKHSNLILVHSKGTILDAAKRITHRVNRIRETLPGLPYQLPPAATDQIDPFASNAVDTLLEEFDPHSREDAEALARQLQKRVAGISPFLARELALRILETRSEGSTEADRRQNLRIAWQQIFPAAQAEAFSPVEVVSESGKLLGAYPFPIRQWPEALQHPVSELNFALDDAFAATIERAEFEAVANALKGKIDREIKRAERQKQAVEKTLQECERAEQHRQAGELLLANLWRIPAGADKIVIEDFFDPDLTERTLLLDPRLSARENADACFRRYRKARDGAATTEEQGEKLERVLHRLRDARARQTELSSAEDIRMMRQALLDQGLLRASEEGSDPEKAERSGPDFQGHKIRRYTTPEGYEIYLGETATANDFLTTRVAASNDLWLHVRASTSAHVIVRTHGQPDKVPRSVLERAALLCAQHSSQKHSALVPVDYTLKKYVRKPRRAAPGSADYTHETTLHITP